MDAPIRRDAAFHDTCWTLVRRATDPSQQTLALKAMGKFCADYWYPVYVFVRRKGYGREEAEDQTQVFFNRLANEGLLARADREEGRLRDFLLAKVRAQLKDFREKAGAKKRGGDLERRSLDFQSAEGRYLLEVRDPGMTPEQLFAQAWAYSTLEIAIRRLHESWVKRGREAEFAALSRFLNPREVADTSSAELAKTLGTTEENARQKVRRVREAFGVALRGQIAETLAKPEDRAVDEELANLRAALLPD